MDCGTDIRGINEYSGSFEYRSDETDKFVGQYRMVAAGFVQITAFVICVAAWFVTGKEGSISGIVQVKPWYMLLGGVIGAFITLTVIVSMDQLGPARAAQLIVVSQIAAAYLIELFGLFGVDKANFQWSKVLGLGLSIIGIMIVKWK